MTVRAAIPALLAVLMALPAAAERLERQFGAWTLVRDGSNARYCWISAVGETGGMPADRMTESWGERLPYFAIALGSDGSVGGYGGKTGVKMRSGAMVWLAIDGSLRFAQANGPKDGLFWANYETADLVEALRGAARFRIAGGGPGIDSTDDLGTQAWVTEIPLDGFAAAKAALLDLCGSEKGWDAPPGAG